MNVSESLHCLGEMCTSNAYELVKVPILIFSNTCTKEIYVGRKEKEILFWKCFILIWWFCFVFLV